MSQNHLKAVPKNAFSLVEVMVVLTIIGVLIAMAVPHYERTVEQSRADIAAANLRAIWTAQRLYWLENHAYTSDLGTLRTAGLLDPAIGAVVTGYSYALTAATANSFTATATRSGSERWYGVYSIDEAGTLSGVVQALGVPDIVPGFQ